MRPVFLLQAPATGDGAIHQHLAELTGGFQLLHHSAELTAGLPAVLARHPSTGGHLRLADVIEDLDPYVVAVTILRNPTDRFLAHYQSLREMPETTPDPLAKLARSHTVDELVRLPDPLVALLANQQCYHLSTLPPSAALADHGASALQNLACFNVVGDSDELAAVLARVGALCGAGPLLRPPVADHAPSAEARAALSADTLARLEQLAGHDHRLWAAARQPRPDPREARPGRPPAFGARRPAPRATHGSREAVIENVFVHHAGSLYPGGRFMVEVTWHNTNAADPVVVALALRDFTGRLVHRTSTEMLGSPSTTAGPGGQRTLFSFEANFSPGRYVIDVELQSEARCGPRTYHHASGIAWFQLLDRPGRPHQGYAETGAVLVDLAGPPVLPALEAGQLRSWLGKVPARVEPGANFEIEVELFNGTAVPLATLGAFPIHLSYHWKSSDGDRTIVFEGARSKLIPGLPPRSICRWPLHVTAPPEPGIYRLQICLVQEGNRWIGPPELSMDSEPFVEVSVPLP